MYVNAHAPGFVEIIAAIDVKTTVAPRHHIFDDRIADLAFGLEHFSGAAAQFCQQFTVEQKIDPQPFGDGKDPLAVGHLFEHLTHDTFAEGRHSLSMARGAKVTAFA